MVRFLIGVLSVRGIAWLMLALSLFATTVVCQQAWKRQSLIEAERFRSDAATLRSAMREQLRRYSLVLQGVSGLFRASESVTAIEFRSYIDSLNLDRYYPGIFAVGYVEMVEQAERDEFLRGAIRDYGLEEPFRIHPPGERSDYMVVRFIEPIDENRTALGFDAGSEATRRAAATRSCETGKAILSPSVQLVQASDRPACILFQPIYKIGSNPDTPGSRWEALEGWAYAAFQIEDMMRGVGQSRSHKLGYEIYDGIEPSPAKLISAENEGGASTSRGRFMEKSVISDFGTHWTMLVHCPASQPHGPGILSVWILAAGGISISLLIFGIAHSMATTSRRAARLANNMTAELRTQESALRASEERLRMVIDGSYDGIWDWDMETNDVYFSPRWKSMLGYADEEIEPTFRSWKELLHPDDRERALKVIREYFEGETPIYQLEHRLRHKDGSYRWILARGVVSRDAEGKPMRMAGSHVDLTNLKQAEQDLRQLNEDLQRSQIQQESTLRELRTSHQELEKAQLELVQAAKLESVGTLAAGVAHEVKNPLQIMLMGLEFLDRKLGGVDETVRTTLSDMRDAAHRADSITKELLHFSSSSSFSPTLIDLEVVLERSLHLVKTELTASKVSLVRELNGDLPPVSIDAGKIQQVLINLIVNAIQAMDRVGTLTVTTACGPLAQFLPDHGGANVPLQPNDTVVILRIQDTGPGIPEDQLARIFDPFFTTKEIGTGTGLGLSVVKKIVDLHGGVIHCANAQNSGIEVTLAFAVASEAAPDPANESAPNKS